MSEVKVNKISPRSGTGVTLGDNGDTFTVPSGAILDIASGGTIDATGATITGFDAASDEKVKVSSNDTTPGFLNGKLVAGTNITLTEGTDGGNETFTVAAAAGGITVADQWRLTAQKNTTSSPSDISANLEQTDTAGQGNLGSSMTESSGVFTFPSTGTYLVMANATYKNISNNNSNFCEIFHKVTINNSSYLTTAFGYVYFNSLSSTLYSTATAMDMINVTDTSNVKIKFGALSQQNAALDSSSTENYTCFTFIRLGDST